MEEKTLPEGWKNKELGDICDVVGGGTPKTKVSEYWDGEVVWLSPIDLPPIGEISFVSDSRKKITDLGLQKSSAKLLPKGSVVYSTRASIGKIAIAEVPLSTNQGFTNFICNEQISNYFLCYALKHFNKNIEELSNSTTFKEVSKTAIKSFKIPLPHLSEQKLIVAKIDGLFAKIDKAISLTEESLVQAKNLLPSVLKEVFEKGKADGWEEKKLTEICEKIFAGGDKPKDYFSKTKTDECSIPIFSNGIKEDGLYGYTKEPKVIKPSVTISARGTIGYTVYRTEPFVPIIRLIVLTPNQEIVSANFLMIVIKNLEILNVGSAIPQLTVPMIKNYSVLVPNQDIQEKISDLVGVYETKITQSKSKLEEQLAYLKQLKSSILSKAFKGEL